MIATGQKRLALVAPDSFKGTFSATEATGAIARGCESAGWRVDRCPLADGGEGTAEVLRSARGGRTVDVDVQDPLGRPTGAEIVVLGDGAEAIVEVASAGGLTLLGEDERDPWRATTRGTGELICAAAALDVLRVLVAAGGSATVDGGRGAIDVMREDRKVSDVEITVLCDVVTPWEECASIYGPQKGADAEMVGALHRRLGDLAGSLPRDPSAIAFGGAAGGLAGGLWAEFEAELRPGARYVFEAVDLDRRLRAADLVITGEGRLDDQSAQGKIVGELARQALEVETPLHLVVGSDRRSDDHRHLRAAAVREASTLAELEAVGREIALTSRSTEL